MLFAIGDLHLPGGQDKSMDVFGPRWANHTERIRTNWCSVVTESDTVIIAGDVSWAIDLQSFTQDFAYIENLPGRKIIIKGNHDYWWDGINRLNALSPSVRFIQNTAAAYDGQDGVYICGTRGWLCPGTEGFTAQDDKIYRREAARLKFSLDAAMAQNAKKIVAVTHFPPYARRGVPTLFTELLSKYPVITAPFGHLHQMPSELPAAPYKLVSADCVNFTPVLIC